MLEMVSSFKERYNLALSIRNIKAIEISEKTGISESTLSQYKGGYSKPKDKRLYKIAEVLNVTPEWLMGLNVPMDEEERAKKILESYSIVPAAVIDSPDLEGEDLTKITEAMKIYKKVESLPPKKKALFLQMLDVETENL